MKPYDPTIAAHPRHPDTDVSEGHFRYQVRDILGLSWDTRDLAIFDELRRLKAVEHAADSLAAEVRALAAQLRCD